MEEFIHDTVLEAGDICNLKAEQDQLITRSLRGEKLIVFGKRNTGKTSVVESIVIPKFLSSKKGAFVLNADFLGVHSLDEIARRLARAFERAAAKCFPTKNALNKLLDILRGVNPSITANPDGSWSFSIAGWNDIRKTISLDEVFDQVQKIEKNNVPVLIVLDEFQDIAFVKGAAGVIRNHLQHLSKKTSIICLGSKKHLLGKLFSAHQAPFFNWGHPIEFAPIHYTEYWRYMQKRFESRKITIALEESTYLQDLFQRIPEPINTLCLYLLHNLDHGKISKEDIDSGLKNLIEARRSKMDEYLTHFSPPEIQVMTALAKADKITSPTGKDFLALVTVSKAGVQKIILKFLDQAVIYHDDDYHMADPLLKHHLKMFR